MIGFDRDYIRL